MENRIKDITVVGGGTAGWLSAMILNSFLNRPGKGGGVRVTVIESPNIPTVGVGEATVTGMARLLAQLGINETAFFRACNASFKLSVRFGDWSRQENGDPLVFYHPFNLPPVLEGQVPAYHYQRFGPTAGSSDFADSMVVNTALIRGLKGPRRLGVKDYDSAIGYAYHLDAGLFSRFLRSIAAKRGIRHIADEVTEVKLDDKGQVAALELEQGGSFPVEFVVDCTGFKGLVIQKALGEPFQPYGDNLLCDRAIPVQIPHPDPSKLEPCTRSTALGAGWVWRVPLYSRIGTGYVYSSKFRSEDEARAEFFAHLRANGDLPADAPDPDTRVIQMRVGRTRRAWVKNCVAIGLSGGFIEPLESTAIFMIEMASRWLINYLPGRDMKPALATQYNRLIEGLYEEVRDFIVTHYATSNRSDPFWQAAREADRVPQSLKDRLELWRHTLPSMLDTRGSTLFNHWNYLYSLWPKGFFAAESYPLGDTITRAGWDAFGQQLAQQRGQLLSALPNHYELLSQIRGENRPAGQGQKIGSQFGGYQVGVGVS